MAGGRRLIPRRPPVSSASQAGNWKGKNRSGGGAVFGLKHPKTPHASEARPGIMKKPRLRRHGGAAEPGLPSS